MPQPGWPDYSQMKTSKLVTGVRNGCPCVLIHATRHGSHNFPIPSNSVPLFSVHPHVIQYRDLRALPRMPSVSLCLPVSGLMLS